MFKPGDRVLFLNEGYFGWRTASIGKTYLSFDNDATPFCFSTVYGIVHIIDESWLPIKLKLYRKHNNVQVVLAGFSFDELIGFPPSSLKLLHEELPSLEES